ncbi:GIY-YIG nuclease family protein [Paraburkholderia aspalathi]|nr:GIY-YIG nuclease family protein [Paraburkholderia aspalathi]
MTMQSSTASKSSGFVYVMSNPSMPGTVKIGKTTRSPEVRRAELSSATGVPVPFHIEGFIECENVHVMEILIHEKLKRYRVNRSREFFKIEPSKAIAFAKKVASSNNARYRKSKSNADNSAVWITIIAVFTLLLHDPRFQHYALIWAAITLPIAIKGWPKFGVKLLSMSSMFGVISKTVLVGFVIYSWLKFYYIHPMLIIGRIIEWFYGWF